MGVNQKDYLWAGLQEGEQIVTSLDQDEIEAGCRVEITGSDAQP